MSLVDVLLPLVIGFLLVARPQLFFKGSSAEQAAPRIRRLRMIGYVLLGVAALYFVIAVVRPR